MRILFWCRSWLPAVGGTEVLGARLVEGLRRRGHDLLVLSEGRGGDDGVVRLPFHEVLRRRDPAGHLALRRDVRRVAAEFAPDLVVLFDPAPDAWFLPEDATPLVTHVQTQLPPSGPDGLLAQLLARSAAVIAPSRSTAATLPAPAVVVSNGVEVTGPPAPLPADSRFVAAGRLVREKGFDVAVEAMSLLRPSLPGPGLTIAGNGVEREALEELARRRGVADHVRFAGMLRHEQVGALIDECCALLVPSRSEAFGLVAAEAMMRGRAVVASRAGGLPEVVRHGETGLLVDVDDPRQLAGAMELLLRDRSALESMGREARRVALACFNEVEWLGKIESIYHVASGAAAVAR